MEDKFKEMKILHIETATSVCSVALSIGGTLVAYRDHQEANIHASKLTVFIQEILSQVDWKMAALQAVSVSKGPGSYTGLRIGVSVAKGICYALDIPLIAVPTLDAMVNGFAEANGSSYKHETWFCPMLDARRMEVYTATYNAELRQLEETSARIIDATSFDDHLNGKQSRVLFGDGANKFSDLFRAHQTVSVYNDFSNSARHLVEPSYQRLLNKQFEDVAYFEPFYLKDFVPTTPKRLLKR